MTSLKNAVVLVTGANGGLGTEFVHQALERGAAKVYASARNPKNWDDDRIVPLPLDVTDSNSIDAAAKAANDTTILINNAGLGLIEKSLLDAPIDHVRQMLDINTIGLLAVSQAFAPALQAAHGAMINVASVASWRPHSILAAYGASKAAVWSLTDSLRTELQPQGVQVLGLYLAGSDTKMTAALDVPKSKPADVIRQAYVGLEAGAFEVLADEQTRQVRSHLSDIIT